MIRSTFLLYLLTSFPIIAETLHLESGARKNTLIELYTSEGCSSCPPAEEYLNKYRKNKALWKTVIPVAFHVNYWDYLGWRDRYAHTLFGQRQSQYAQLKRVSTVYTPAFIVNGEGWRPGLFSRDLPRDDQKSGKLVIDIKDEQIYANYKTTRGDNIPLTLNVAVLGMGLSTAIERGENSGRKAKHEFVVVGYDTSTSENATWKMALPKRHYKKAKEHAIAVWVSSAGNPTPLQAVGGRLLVNQ